MYIMASDIEDQINKFKLARIYLRFSILVTCGKHLHDDIISLRREVCAHITSLTPPLSIEIRVPTKKSELSCISVIFFFTFSYEYNI